MRSVDGRYVITYNGEVFNYQEIRLEIGDQYQFKTGTDTEVVLAAYILWGKNIQINLKMKILFTLIT